MKTMTCRDLGGPCDHKLSAGSWNEMVEVMTRHLEEHHPETAVEIERMNEENPGEWEREMELKWEKIHEDSF